MAAKKKVEKPVTSAQLITVDAGKLSQGLKHTFEGVAMVFDSLGMQVDIGMKAEDEAAVEPVSTEEKIAVKAEPEAEPAPAEEQAVEAEPETPVAEEEQEAEVPVVTAPSVSIDDITKIIVQKIKQNRKNNEKIGAILKTYGASKVGELPVDKYEAFLTDLSAI